MVDNTNLSKKDLDALLSEFRGLISSHLSNEKWNELRNELNRKLSESKKQTKKKQNIRNKLCRVDLVRALFIFHKSHRRFRNLGAKNADATPLTKEAQTLSETLGDRYGQISSNIIARSIQADSVSLYLSFPPAAKLRQILRNEEVFEVDLNLEPIVSKLKSDSVRAVLGIDISKEVMNFMSLLSKTGGFIDLKDFNDQNDIFLVAAFQDSILRFLGHLQEWSVS